MHPELAQDPAFVDRFKQEIGTLYKLGGHKHLVEIHGFGYAADAACWYFLMEFIDGQSLQQMLQKKGPLGVIQARGLFLAVADGLAAAQAQNIVHRDVKPGNILVRPAAPPVLVDFGLATPASGKGLTTTGRATGCTVMFAAPEQLRGKPADARTDVYCLAASMYYSLNYDKPDLREPDQYEPRHAPEPLRKRRRRRWSRSRKNDRLTPGRSASCSSKTPRATRKPPVQPSPQKALRVQPLRRPESGRTVTPPPLPNDEEFWMSFRCRPAAPSARLPATPDPRLGITRALGP